MTDKPFVSIHTDGACSPNPGVGGWGAILVSPRHDKREEISGAEAHTTNNRMELRAALEALRALKRPCTVRLHSDSRYLCNAFEKGWLQHWQRNGWRTADKRPVINQDLWEALLRCEWEHEITWVWVRGHADDPDNIRCDELAVAAREAKRRAMDTEGD